MSYGKNKKKKYDKNYDWFLKGRGVTDHQLIKKLTFLLPFFEPKKLDQKSSITQFLLLRIKAMIECYGNEDNNNEKEAGP